jgi:hypothetical protein
MHRLVAQIPIDLADALRQVEGGPDGDTAHFVFDFYAMHGRGAGGGGDDMGEGPVVNSEEAEGESRRWRAVHESDPVSNLKLRDFMRQQMAAAAGAHGNGFGAMLSRMDPAVAVQLRQALAA